MTKQQHVNNYRTALSADITDTDTSFDVDDATRVPGDVSVDEPLLMTLVPANATLPSVDQVEIVEVTAVTVDTTDGSGTLTVNRGQDGTTAKAFSIGATVGARATARSLNRKLDTVSWDEAKASSSNVDPTGIWLSDSAGGFDNGPTGANATVIGPDGLASADKALASGGSEAKGVESVALGANAKATGEDSFAASSGTASGKHAAAFGEFANASGNYSVCLGGQNNAASGFKSATVAGDNAGANGTANAVIGSDNGSTESGTQYSVVVGGSNNGIEDTAQTSGVMGGSNNGVIGSAQKSAVAAGANNNVENSASGSFIGGGDNNGVSGDYSAVVAGVLNSVSAGYSHSAILGGDGNTVNANRASCVGGQDNTVSGHNSVAMGNSNQVSGADSLAIGNNNQISGQDSLAVGYGNNAFGSFESFAFGYRCYNPVTYGLAIAGGYRGYFGGIAEGHQCLITSRDNYTTDGNATGTAYQAPFEVGPDAGSTMAVSGQVAATAGAGGDKAAWTFAAMVYSDGTNAQIQGLTKTQVAYTGTANNWDFTLIDSGNGDGSFEPEMTGEAGTDIDWSMAIQAAHIVFASGQT